MMLEERMKSVREIDFGAHRGYFKLKFEVGEISPVAIDGHGSAYLDYFDGKGRMADWYRLDDIRRVGERMTIRTAPNVTDNLLITEILIPINVRQGAQA